MRKLPLLREESVNRQRNLHRGWYDKIDKGGGVTRVRYADCCESVRDLYGGGTVIKMYIPLDIWIKSSSETLEGLSDVSKVRVKKIEQEMRDWVTFLRQCMFPIHYEGITEINDTNLGTLKSCMTVSWKQCDLTDQFQSLMCLSVIRYFYSAKYTGMPDAVYAVKTAHPHLTNTEALILGHYLAPSTYTGYYGLISKDKIFLPMTNSRLEVSLKSGSSINNTFTKGVTSVTHKGKPIQYGAVARDFKQKGEISDYTREILNKVSETTKHEIRI